MKHLFIVSAIILSAAAWSVDTNDTRLLQMPSMGGNRLAFVYDHDIWLAPRSGGLARRVTTADGMETNPVLSEDGQWLALSANYDGNTDVYVMPASGGEVTRLTWHPGADIVRGFTPDASAVLFQSPRSVYTRRHRHLYTVPVEGGFPARLPIPTGFKSALSGDGTKIAYSPHAERFGQWKNYRGGTVSRVWIMDLNDFDVEEIPQPDGRANDTDPMWVNGTVYFVSDRDGEFNLYRFTEGDVQRLTEFDEFPIIDARASGTDIVFEHAGRLRVYDTVEGAVQTLAVSAPSDLRESRPRWASGDEWMRDFSIAPDAQRVALEYRGEIVTVPAEKGDSRNLTRSPGSHDRSPAWSPDGTQIAWFSDAGGEYALYIASQDDGEDSRAISLDGAGFYFDPVWSPDGRFIAFRDNALTLHLMEIASGRQTTIAQEPVYSPIVTMTYSWSPDSRWLAYTLNDNGLTQQVYLYSLDDKTSVRVTDGLAEMSEPVFDPNGLYLYMLGSTNAGPAKDWFAQSSIDMAVTHQVYVATLAESSPGPLPPESDEVSARQADDESAGDKEESTQADEDPPSTEVDYEGLLERIDVLPMETATLHSLNVGKTGEVYFIETRGRTSFSAFSGEGALRTFTLNEREAKTLGEGVSAYQLSSDASRLAYRKENSLFIVDAGNELEAGKGKVALDRVQVRVEPRAEWAQIIDEIWRINRDYFYATNFHGADWDAVREKYRPFVEHAATRDDIERIGRWMSSELAVGHSYSGSGDSIEEPEDVSVGLLGADFEVADGHYRFARVYGGLNWTPDLVAPLKKAGVNVDSGEYLLAVNGEALTADENVFSRFENTAGRQVVLTVGVSTSGRDAREVTVVPVASESDLRNRSWVEGNLARVHQATDGRVAYVHVPDTSVSGHEYFKRYFFPQSHMDGIIVDERNNGGGLFSDYYIDILRRPFAASWAMRYGDDLISPRGAIYGPKVMLINEGAGSGGDLLPWMFSKYDLGPLIGTRTWGGLVGILGFPVLMDGGGITAPNLAIWNEDGWIVENVGVPPDIEVVQWPKDVNAGRDPQLERAIEEILKRLESWQSPQTERPDFPTRAR